MQLEIMKKYTCKKEKEKICTKDATGNYEKKAKKV
jgi:hypothetical protein